MGNTMEKGGGLGRLYQAPPLERKPLRVNSAVSMTDLPPEDHIPPSRNERKFRPIDIALLAGVCLGLLVLAVVTLFLLRSGFGDVETVTCTVAGTKIGDSQLCPSCGLYEAYKEQYLEEKVDLLELISPGDIALTSRVKRRPHPPPHRPPHRRHHGGPRRLPPHLRRRDSAEEEDDTPMDRFLSGAPDTRLCPGLFVTKP